jgi:serine protease Do
MRSTKVVRARGAALVTLGLLTVVGCRQARERPEIDPSPAPVPVPAPVPPSPIGIPLPASASPAPTLIPAGAPVTFADLAEKTNPGVVFVRTLHAQQFGFRRVVNQGSGSGFIFDKKGLILTNFHVVRDANAIQVELLDRRAVQAQVVGADPLTDIAVLRVTADGLTELPLGDSDAARVGDWLVAIGNPFGLSHTVSAGILSARGRTKEDVGLGDPRAYYSFIQTDASINPGNSGGPLLDLQGRVVGINTAINPEANSIGFAIPINMVRELLPRLLADGVIERAAIGVHVADEVGGARVMRVMPGGPADDGGIREGDIITQVNGRQVQDSTSLRWLTSLAPIGKKVPFQILRAGASVSLELVPARLELN